MKYSWLDEYLLSKKATEKDFKEEWGATRYCLNGKMYAMIGGDSTGKPIITLKGDPELAESLRTKYSDIVPGYYMNKQHWNSVYLEGDVPDNVLKEMADAAYHLLLRSLSKKAQQEIAAQ